MLGNIFNLHELSYSVNSFIAVPTFCFLIWSLKKYTYKAKSRHILIATFIYSFFWEFFGYLNIYGTYDINDIIAALIGGIVTLIILKLTNNTRSS